MSQYGLIQAIFMSFYSRKLYRDVAVNWGGKSWLYLLFILALSWIPFIVKFQHNINEGYHHYSDEIVPQVPVLSIRNGVLTTPENRPYMIADPSTNKQIAMIDTSGQFTTLDQAKTSFLITQTEIISQPKPGEIRINKIPSVNMDIKPQVINTFLAKFLSFVWVILFPLLLISSFIYRVIEVLLYSILGKLFNAVCGAELSYGQLMQLTMVALTPTIVCATIFDYFGILFKHPLSFYFLLSMLYLLYAVIANKNKALPQ